MRRIGPGRVADLWAVLLTGYLLWPLHHVGYPLGRDMVFSPSQSLTNSSVGLASGSARAVPLDALVALAGHVVNGSALGRIVVVVPLVGAAWGMRRLLGSPQLAASLAVSGLAVWNPFTVERLALGQWALLWSYAAVPWLILLARRLRDAGDLSPVRRRVLWSLAVMTLAAAAITPTGAVIGGVVFTCLVWSGRSRVTLYAVAATVMVQLPWLVPSVLGGADATSDPAAVTAFASRGEHGGGVFVTLIGLGGIWDRGVTSPRSIVAYLLGVLVVLAGFGFGIRAVWASLGRSSARRLCWLSLAGFVLAALAALPGGTAGLEWAVRTLPGAGLLRDAQKWLMPFVVLAVLCMGAAVGRLSVLGRPALIVATALGLTLPALVLPAAARTLEPTLTPSIYPSDWYTASRYLNARSDAGAVLVLPYNSYRRFDWVAASSVLDPAPRWLDADTVVNDQLAVSGRLLRGEDRRAAAIGSALRRDRKDPTGLASALARAGIAHVWVEKGTPGVPLPDVSGLELVRPGTSVEVFRVPGPIAEHSVATPRRIAVVSVDLLALLVVGIAAAILLQWGARSCYSSLNRIRSEDRPWAS